MRLQPILDEQKMKIGGMVFDPDTGELVLPGREAPRRLRPLAAKLLLHLAEHPGQLVRRGELQQVLWGDRVVDTEQGLNACVRDVRRALGDSAATPSLLETLPGRGYRLIAPVTRISATRRPWRWASLAAGVALVALLGLWLLQASPSRTVHRDAQTLVLEAEYLAKTGDHDALLRSRSLLEAAIALDSDFAPAHSELAHVSFLTGHPEQAREAAERALRLDPDLAEAHAAVGFLHFYETLDPERAREHLEHAVRLDPASAVSRQVLAHFLIVHGEPRQAVEQIQVALELDPADARLRGDASWIFYWAGRFPEAADHARRTLVLAPNDQAARICLFRALVAGGRTAEAAATLVDPTGSPELAAAMGRGRWEPGSPDDTLRRYWSRLAESSGPSSGRLLAFSQLGRSQDARRELAHLAKEASPIDLRHLLLDPLLDPIRDSITPLDHRARG